MKIFLFIAATLAAVSAQHLGPAGLIHRGIPQNVMQLSQPGLIQREMLHPGLVGHPGLIQREMLHPGMVGLAAPMMAQPAPMMMAHPAPMMMAHPAPMIDLRELPVPYFHTEILPEPYIHIEGPAGPGAPLAEPYIHIEGPSGSDAPAALPYVHVDGPAGSDAPAALPYVHDEGAAGSDAPAAVPYVHIEGPGAPIAEPYFHTEILAEPYIHIEPLPQLQALDGRALNGLALGLPVDARMPIDALPMPMMGGITGVRHLGNVIGGPVLDAGLVGLPHMGGVRHLGAVPAGLAIGATHGLPLDAGMMRTWGPAPAVHGPLRMAF